MKKRYLLVLALAVFILADLLLLFFFFKSVAPGPPARPATTLAVVPARMPSLTPLPTQTPMPTLIPTSATLVPTATPAGANVDIDSILAQMSLEQKVGQMIIAVIPGKTAKGTGEDLFRGRQIGGIVLYEVNITDAQQAFSLIADLQRLAAGSKPAIPLLVALDHEGGRMPFQSGVTLFPPLMAIGAANSPDLAYQAGLVAGRELRAVGINTSFGPVLDINDNPANPVIGLRSFGDSPERVSALGTAYINGLRDGGVIAVAKHFPGHGDTDIDSHVALPFINRAMGQLDARAFIPFRAAIQDQVPGIMVGHIANTDIDTQGLPASLSPALNNGLLRQHLGYEGVVITDALTMYPVRRAYSPEEVGVRAVSAGNDILLFTNPADAMLAQAAIMDAVRSGGLPAEVIDASVRRILLMKARGGLFEQRPAGLPGLPLDQDAALAAHIARQAIYAPGAQAYPLLKPGRLMVISPDRLSRGSQEGDNRSLLGELLSQRGFAVDEWIYSVKDPAQTADLVAKALKKLPDYPAAVVVSYNAELERYQNKKDAQVQLIEEAYASGVPLVFVAASSPYDLAFAPPGQPALATFGDTPAQIAALVDALLSDTPPAGILPVQVK